MKIAVIVVRILMGLMFLFASVVVLFHLVKQPAPQGKTKIFMEGIMASGYLMTLIKITELVCAIALLIGRFAPLATVVIFPITLNIFLYHACIGPEGLVTAALLLLANLFLAYAYRKHYITLVAPKAQL